MRFQTAVFLLGGVIPVFSGSQNIVLSSQLLTDNASKRTGDAQGSNLLERRKQRGQFFQQINQRIDPRKGVLINSPARVECSPNPEQSNDPDIGLLSCGTMMYCAESETSSLGGICMPDPSTEENRDLEVEDDLCSKLKSSNFFDSCDCTNFDSATQSGTIDCFKEDDCFRDFGLDDLCATLYARFDADADGSYTYEYAYDFHSPYVRSYSFHYAYPEKTCKIVIDSKDCKSCTEEDCGMMFDCSNTIVGTQRSTCEESVNILPIFDDILSRGHNVAGTADTFPGQGPASDEASSDGGALLDGSGGTSDLQSQVLLGLGLSTMFVTALC